MIRSCLSAMLDADPSMRVVALFGLSLSAFAACSQPAPPADSGGGSGTAGDTDGVTETESLYPLVDGAAWSYDNLDAAGATVRIEDVAVTANDDGTYLLADTPNEVGQRTDAIIERRDTAALRTHKDVYQNDILVQIVDYTPGFIRMDDAWTSAGAIHMPIYMRHETNGQGGNPIDAMREHQFEVLAVDEEVTVPAGTFSCVKVLRTRIDPGSASGEQVTFWYAPGVGKVRELRIDRAEELRFFDIPGGLSSK